MRRRDVVVWIVFFSVMGIIAVAIASKPIYCLQVKGDYESNPELASEKYGYSTFEQWVEEEPLGKIKENCAPDIKLPEMT